MEEAILIDLMSNYVRKHSIKALMELVLRAIRSVDNPDQT